MTPPTASCKRNNTRSKMKALVLLLTLSSAVSLLSVNGNVYETEDAIIVEASDIQTDAAPKKTRAKREISPIRAKGLSPVTTWGDMMGEGGVCVTSKAAYGRCKSFKSCYPYFKKVPDLGIFDSWVLGQYDTCTFITNEGRQAFGVCCDDALKPSDSVNIVAAYVNNWPPPIPTHPPNHAAPTHPSVSGSWPSGFPSTTSTQRPGAYPWPPPLPTHRPVSPVATRPTTPPPPLVQSDVGDYCGAKNGNQDQERIVGGQNASPNEWPWIAVLFNNGRQFCGGSLIDHNHILTAAHCVAHMSAWDVARLTVQLGDHNIRSPNEVQHIERKVKRVVRHRSFDMRTLYSDIALLTMDSPVTYTKTVRPICLPQQDTSRQFNGAVATVIGWGSLRENGPQPSVLQKVSIPIWTNAQCRNKYGNAAPGGIIDSMICAGEAARDSCSGDSGGPLMINEGHWTQVGVVSWGIGCGQGQYPGVYTRVTSFIPWIVKNIQLGK